MRFHFDINLSPLKINIKSDARDPAVVLKAQRRHSFICSYPKSGNTWMRFLVANLLYPHLPVVFANIDFLVPDIYRLTRRNLSQFSTPIYLKSHEPFRPDYRRVLYICRDPRDVLVSYYHYSRKQGSIADNASIESFAELFLNGRLTSDNVGMWGENVGSWLGARRHDRRFHLLRYEDLVNDTESELRRAADFLEIPYTDETLLAAVDASSPQHMKRLEAEEADYVKSIRKRKDIPFIRNAKAGSWQDELPTSIARAVEEKWSPLMQRLNYLN